jgi:Ser/Thr protein kinase RdoA (MazF antagonist)
MPENHLPTIHSLVDVEALATLLERQYGLSGVRCQLIKGTIRDVYHVVTSGSDYVLCLYRHNARTAGQILAEIKLIETLHDADVTVAPPTRTVEGHLLFSVIVPEGERYATLCEYVEGDQLAKQPDTNTVKEYGRVVAQIHTVSDQMKHAIERPKIDFEFLVEQSIASFAYAAPQRKDDLTFLQEIAAVLKPKMESLSTEKPLYGLVHGDIIPSNTLISPDGRLTIVDFDLCGYGWRSYDIATFLVEARYWNMGQKIEQAFLEGYQSVRQLSVIEYEMLPIMETARNILSLGIPASYINTWGRVYFSPPIIEKTLLLLKQNLTLL